MIKAVIILICSLYLSVSLNAEVTLDIEIPLDGMNQSYRNMLEIYIENFQNTELKDLVNNMLYKPQISHTLSQCLGLSSALNGLAYPSIKERSYLYLGSDAVINAPYYQVEPLTDYLENLSMEEDPAIGAGFQIWQAGSGFLTPKILRGSSAHISAGYLSFQQDLFNFTNFSLQLNMAYQPFKTKEPANNFSWQPLEIRLGAGFRWMDFYIKAITDPMTETFDLDLDGPGPLPSQQVEIQALPKIDIQLQAYALTFPLQCGTAFTFFKSIHLSLGASLLPAITHSAIGLTGSGQVYLLNYQAEVLGLTEENSGTISAKGLAQGEGGDFISGFCWGRLMIEMGQIYINIPVVYQPGRTIGAGIYMGVNL